MSIKREQGFTLIELLIVGVIVCILATLVAMTYSGVQAKNRNANRQTSIDTIQSKLEAYYAQASKYPSLAELNDPQWRQNNLNKLAAHDTRDPSWNERITGCTAGDEAIFSSSPVEKCYSYQSTATDGSVCDSLQVVCTQYTLTTILEGGEKYVKSSLN